MPSEDEITLMAHLMRRAGFGAPREELEARVAKGYEATVDELLHPEEFDLADEYILARYRPGTFSPGGLYPDGPVWMTYHAVNTKRPLEEKMTLFWHNLFATGNAKVGSYDEMQAQIALFRDNALGNYKEMLLQVARNPQMIYWLDNQENHRYAVNENWGRELLELFSMGVGNYTEEDVREASRAFTGWSIAPKLPLAPHGRFLWKFEYREEDHDDGEKTFLGQTGRFNGEDIIDIIVRQPACARFIARHLYSYFVADEPQVPSWSIELPRDPEAIDTLARVFTEANYELRPVLRTLFNADFFKEARFARVKSPTEVVAGTLRLVGGHEFPTPFNQEWAMQTTYMGQDLLNPPSVEGWHTGKEWLNSGSLMTRINFVADLVGDTGLPGVQAIISRLKSQGDLSPEALVDGCLDLMGPLEVAPQTRKELIAQAKEGGTVRWDMDADATASEKRVAEMLQLIVATREYQFA